MLKKKLKLNLKKPIKFGNTASANLGNGDYQVRILGKLSTESSANIFFNKAKNLFVCDVIEQNMNKDKFEEATEYFSLQCNVINMKTVTFEWGGFNGCSSLFFILDEKFITNVSDFDSKDKWKQEGRCLSCGDIGYWHQLTLFCKWHGRII